MTTIEAVEKCIEIVSRHGCCSRVYYDMPLGPNRDLMAECFGAKLTVTDIKNELGLLLRSLQ